MTMSLTKITKNFNTPGSVLRVILRVHCSKRNFNAFQLSLYNVLVLRPWINIASP